MYVPGLEFFGAKGVGDVLNGVTQTVGVVIGGVDTPGVPRVRVRGELDPVGHWVLLSILHDVFHPQRGLGRRQE